jgi:hypothetical protein
LVDLQLLLRRVRQLTAQELLFFPTIQKPDYAYFYDLAMAKASDAMNLRGLEVKTSVDGRQGPSFGSCRWDYGG